MKIILNTIYLILSIYVQTTSAQIQGFKIKGKVYNDSKQELAMAVVSISNTKMKTTTDGNGNYLLNGLKAGSYVVNVEAYGYKTVSQTVSIGAENSISIDFYLKTNEQILNEVIIENHKTILKQEKESFAIETVNLKKLQNQSIELNTILNQTAGIKVRQDGGLGSRSLYSINGLGGKAVRFFLDGVPMDYFGSSYSINTLPVSMIDKIEIYKGVVPVELGSDALGGAINLVPKTVSSNTTHLSYSFGSFNTHRASIQGNWRNTASGASLKIAAFYNYSDNNYTVWGNDIYATDPTTFETKRNIKVKRFHDAFESKAIKTDVGFTKKKWADEVFAGLLYSNMDKEIQHGTTMENPYGEATYNQHIAMPFLTYKKNDFLTKKLNINLFSSYSNLVRTRIDTSRNIYNWYGKIEGIRTLGGEQNRSLNTLTENVFLNRLNLAYPINENHKIGCNALFSSLNRTDSDPLVTQKTDGYWSAQKLKKNTMGLAYQSLIMNKKINTSVFIKSYSYSAAVKLAETNQGITTYTTIPKSDYYWGYGAATSYKITPDFMLNLSIEKAYRLPESEEILGDGLSIMSTTNLEPESSLNTNLGFKLNLFSDKENQLAISSNLFYRDVSNLIQQWQYNLGTFVYINFDKVQMQGVDAKIEFKHNKNFTIHQTVSYLNPLLKSKKDELGNQNITYNTRLPNTPFLQTNTDIQYQIENGIQKNSQTFVYWNINYVDEFYKHSEIIGKENKDVIPAQLINNCGLGYTFPNKKLSVSCDLNNMFNKQAFDNYAIQKPGRAIYIKANYQF